MNEQSAEELVELDDLQAAYKAAMEQWIVAIRKEEALVSVTPHSVAEVDKWEGAHFEEDEARNKVLVLRHRRKIHAAAGANASKADHVWEICPERCIFCLSLCTSSLASGRRRIGPPRVLRGVLARSRNL